MATSAWITLAGVHALAFAVFHLAFWRLFDWPASLRTTTVANRAILQIANSQLVLVFACAGAACLWWRDSLAATPGGRALLLAMAGFWLLRLAGQVVWLRVHHAGVHALTAAFALGVVACAVPALR